LSCGGGQAVVVVVMGEGAEVLDDGAEWLEVGWVVVVVDMCGANLDPRYDLHL
jgi:hypothetical protein